MVHAKGKGDVDSLRGRRGPTRCAHRAQRLEQTGRSPVGGYDARYPLVGCVLGGRQPGEASWGGGYQGQRGCTGSEPTGWMFQTMPDCSLPCKYAHKGLLLTRRGTGRGSLQTWACHHQFLVLSRTPQKRAWTRARNDHQQPLGSKSQGKPRCTRGCWPCPFVCVPFRLSCHAPHQLQRVLRSGTGTNSQRLRVNSTQTWAQVVLWCPMAASVHLIKDAAFAIQRRKPWTNVQFRDTQVKHERAGTCVTPPCLVTFGIGVSAAR